MSKDENLQRRHDSGLSRGATLCEFCTLLVVPFGRPGEKAVKMLT